MLIDILFAAIDILDVNQFRLTYSTLIWNTIVRYKYPHFVTKTGFVMAELVFKRDFPENPLTPEFALDPDFVKVNILTKP